jgi:hypothetical protein
MPKSNPVPSKGERILKAVKETQARGLAARTAKAVKQLQGSSSVESKNVDNAQEVPQSFSSSSEELWKRQDFGSGNLLVFSRGDGEVLTIRKSPEGDGWIIN